MTIADYSARRGAIIHFFPQIYELLRDYCELPNKIIWTQQIKRQIVDINRRYILAVDNSKFSNAKVLGFLFFKKHDEKILIDYFCVREKGVASALLEKFLRDDAVKAAKTFCISEAIKKEENDESLERVGLLDNSGFKDGYMEIGGYAETLKILKTRYGF